jgi:hypothetical protein
MILSLSIVDTAQCDHQTTSKSISQMITITGGFDFLIFTDEERLKCDYRRWLVAIMITLSSLHCKTIIDHRVFNPLDQVST